MHSYQTRTDTPGWSLGERGLMAARVGSAFTALHGRPYPMIR